MSDKMYTRYGAALPSSCRKKGFALYVVLLILLMVSAAGCIGETGTKDVTDTSATDAPDQQYRYVTDMRGVQVQVPKNIERIATIDDGFVEEVLTNISEIEKVKIVGSICLYTTSNATIPLISGYNLTLTGGTNIMAIAHPWIRNLDCFVSSQGNAVQYEMLAKAEPDIVIVRIGDCRMGAGNTEANDKAISTMESLGIPVVVLYAPSYYHYTNMSSLREEMQIIGQLFDKEQKAIVLADYLESTEQMVRERTKDIPEEEKVTALFFGLSPISRSAGGAGAVDGIDTPESYILEDVCGGKNVYRDLGAGKLLNAEQVLALDPDVLLLPTARGFHPMKELYDATYYRNLQELQAIKNKRVYSLPYTPCNCAPRVEYPIDILIVAKACYPEKFQDIKVHEFMLDFYQDIYGVDKSTAEKMRSVQYMDWLVEYDF